MKITVNEATVKNGLCTSCGICESVCPQSCIEPVKKNGQYVPVIDTGKCTNCGNCSDICSAHKMEFLKYADINQQLVSDDWITGSFLSCYNGYSLNNAIRSNSTSGGLITNIVMQLLDGKSYDKAFLVEDFNYSNIVESKLFSRGSDLEKTSKSRYIPVSHRRMVQYALKNRDEKIIIVATSCVTHTFMNVISQYKLNRDNYLILGLFCDKTFNQNIYRYFQEYIVKNGELENLYFRTKEQTGWPGNMKFELKNGKSLFISSAERMKIKDYFQLERCLYCVDKLNQFADISFGDNYTRQNDEVEGSNSLIIRTEKGREIIDTVKEDIKLFSVDIDSIKKGQNMNGRELNFEFSKSYYNTNNINLYPDFIDTNKNLDIDRKAEKALKYRRKNIEVGKKYPETRDSLAKILKKIEFRVKIKKIIKRLFRL